ncbi:MAG: PAS domain S-box protein [Oligoflexia bacterium]|nr:PAS domain S-box protein [Oligoflexia bacterium]
MKQSTHIFNDINFHTVFESSPSAYLILKPDSKFTILAANKAYTQLTMLDKRKILGKGLFKIFPEITSDPLKASFEKVLKTSQQDVLPLHKYDLKCPNDNGQSLEVRYWDIINSPVLETNGKIKYIVHKVEDVTAKAQCIEADIFRKTKELQETNEKTIQSEDFISSLVEGIKDYAIVRLDTTGHIVSWNEGAKNISGYEAHEILGKHFSKFYPLEDILDGKPERRLKTALKEGRVEKEGIGVKKDGTRFWANLVITPLKDKNARLIGFSAVTRDITKQKETQDQSQLLVEQLKEQDKLKTHFCSSVSHELRTPLSLIIAPISKLLKNEKLSEKGVRDLNVIARNARLLLKQVNDLLDVSRIEEHKLTPTFIDSDLSQIIRITAANFESIAAEKNISLSVKALEPVQAQFDINMIQRVILNLLSNAFKFTPQGGKIVIRAKIKSKSAIIEVEDTGPGIAEEDKEKIFERFNQLNTGVTRKAGGTGLGLTIAKEFIELHKGKIEVFDGPLGGALFLITLPLKIQEQVSINNDAGEPLTKKDILPFLDSLRTMAIKPQKALSEAKANKEKILVVEDNPDLNWFLVELLESKYQVETAFDGEEGFKKACSFKPDLILSDIMMPKISGDEMLRQIKQIPSLKATLTVFLTAKIDDVMKLQILREGAQDYIVKPFVAEEVLARIENLLAIRRVQELSDINTLLENALDCVVVMDQQGFITYWNKQAEKTLGWTKAEAIGRKLSSTVIPPQQRRMHEESIKNFLEKGEDSFFKTRLEVTSLTKDGNEIPIELTVTPIKSQDSYLFYGFIRDISERTKVMEELRQAKDIAEAASHTKSTFLANMSHEIRTPLGVILGFSDLIADQKICNEDKANFITAVKRNGELLSGIINDILDISKVEAGKLYIEAREAALYEIMADVISIMNPLAVKKGIKLSIHYANKTPKIIKTDPIRLKQILLNIIGNAIKFTEKGEVRVNVKLENSNEGSQLLAFEIKDTGCGISETEAKNLFKPFTQIDSTTTRKFGGTGLGLVLSKRLARLLGGDVLLAGSKKNGGSTFKILIDPGPITTYESLHKMRSLNFIEPLPPIRLDGINVLLAEDSFDNQILVSQILKLAGASVDVAENGKVALEMAKLKKYDVLLIDIQMPIMDGYSTVAELRKNGFKTPIIALTAHALREERMRSLASGFDEHISKPIDRNTLVESIAQFCPR